MNREPPPADPSQEAVIIVDKENNVTGAVPRWIMRRDRLIHRATYIVVSNSQQQILVQKRTMSKDIYPGLLEMASGGVVRQGETWMSSAQRELQEETGISDVTLKVHFDFYFEDKSNRVWGRIFSCTWDGALKFQKEEVEWGKFLNQKEIEAQMSTGKFTPDSVYLYKLCKKEGIIP